MAIGVYPRLSGERMRDRLALLSDAQALPLAQKVEFSTELIDSLAEHGPMAIMFSGGRDSCALARVAKHHNPVLLYCDTGMSSPTAADRVKRAAAALDLQLEIVRADRSAFQMWQEDGHYPIGPKRGHTYLKEVTGIKTSPVQCCYQMKEKPARDYIRHAGLGSILWGNRAADSNRRKLGVAEHGLIHEPSNRWPCHSAQPIATWTDDDVAQFVEPLELDFTARAEDGCRFCCTDLARRDNQLTRTFIADREGFDEAILSGLGTQILQARGEPHSEDDVKAALANEPHRFLRIPAIGKTKARGIRRVRN